MRGEPNMTEFSIMNWIGGGGHVNFSPISAPDGAEALAQYNLIKKRCHEFGFDYIGEFLVGWRDMHHILMIMYNRSEEDTSELQLLMRISYAFFCLKKNK